MNKALCIGTLLIAATALGEAPHLPQFLRLQGRFTDTRVPLTDSLPVHFRIWDTPEGYGNLMWEDVQNVSVREDTFQVLLGRTKALTPSVFTGGDRWVELQIGDDDPLKPRYRIPNPYLQAPVEDVRVVSPPVVAAPPPAPQKKNLEMQVDPYQEPAKEKPKPAKKKRSAPPSEEVQGSTYQVQTGDTLKSIAQKLDGNAELWYDLYYLNRDRLGPMGHLFTGQILVLPSDAPATKGSSHP